MARENNPEEFISGDLKIRINDRGVIGNKRYILAEIIDSSDGNAVSYATGGLGSLKPKDFGLDRIERVSVESVGGYKFNYNKNSGKFNAINYQDENASAADLTGDTERRQDGDDIDFLSAVVGKSVFYRNDSSLIYLLDTSNHHIYVYTSAGARNSGLEFTLAAQTESPNAITVDISMNIMYVNYPTLGVFAYYLNEVNSSHRPNADYIGTRLLGGINAPNINDFAHLSYTDDRILVANSPDNRVETYHHNGQNHLGRSLPNSGTIRGVDQLGNKIYILDSDANRVKIYATETEQSDSWAFAGESHEITASGDRVYILNNASGVWTIKSISLGGVEQNTETTADIASMINFTDITDVKIAYHDSKVYFLDRGSATVNRSMNIIISILEHFLLMLAIIHYH